ncbi:hypothetical protein BDQ17DRAFT_1238106 [Cyathus striatus]|nr:hypothetical protein BDQ17DRAFT_1238106 [Cyathus striatus]
MPPPRHLALSNDSLEDDIGEQSPYLAALASASSRGSATTSSTTMTPEHPNQPLRYTVPFKSLARKSSYGQLHSPSSPSLSIKPAEGRPRQLSRSNTLPRVFQLEQKTQRRANSELEGLEIEMDVVKKMQKWILGIAVVEFDVDDGPVIDAIFPPMFLLPSEEENIAFSAFPDSLQFDQGSQCHSFRVREQLRAIDDSKRPATIDGFIYGYSHFTQRKDPSLKRGYQQRSLVILTQYQYPALFTSIARIFGPLYQSHGTPMLEAACHNIATWYDPVPGVVELGFLGTVLHVEIPNSNDEQQITETAAFIEKYDPKLHILASTAPLEPPPIQLFESCLTNLWSIWECVVLCEPILIFGSSPAQTSQAVWWFRDLLRPIGTSGGDIRPYFTMQDMDHAALVNKLPPKAGLLLGVTNPFFEKSCAHWPHILSLGRRTQSQHRRAGDTPAGPAPGWRTKTHKRYISKDRALLSLLENACKGNERSKMDASLLIRRHFCQRTTQMITPLQRYLHTLLPSPKEVTHAQTQSSNTPLRLKPFNNANFFASLKAHGSVLPFKSTSRRTEFYERWLRSPAFGAWLAQQEQIVQGVLEGSGG